MKRLVSLTLMVLALLVGTSTASVAATCAVQEQTVAFVESAQPIYLNAQSPCPFNECTPSHCYIDKSLSLEIAVNEFIQCMDGIGQYLPMYCYWIRDWKFEQIEMEFQSCMNAGGGNASLRMPKQAVPALGTPRFAVRHARIAA